MAPSIPAKLRKSRQSVKIFLFKRLVSLTEKKRRTRDQESRVRLHIINQELCKLAGTVADHYRDLDRFMTVFLSER